MRDAQLARDREIVHTRSSRDGHDLHVRQFPPQGRDGLDAVHFRHEKVGHDGIEPLPVDEVQGLLAVPRGEDLVALPFERETQVIPQLGIVFDDKDSHAATRCNRRSGALVGG